MLNKTVKSLLLSTSVALGLIGSAHAAVDGPYLGGQVGWGDTHYDSRDFGTNNYSNDGIAGRALLGYQFQQNAALELGYTQFHNATTDQLGGEPGVDGKIRQYDIDLMAKGIIPLQNGFSINGKVGAAFVHANANARPDATDDDGYDSTSRRILPAFGAGVSYDITPNVPVELSWVHIQKTGSATIIRNSDFVGLGVAYHFGV